MYCDTIFVLHEQCNGEGGGSLPRCRDDPGLDFHGLSSVGCCDPAGQPTLRVRGQRGCFWQVGVHGSAALRPY